MNLALKLTEDEAVLLYKAMADYQPNGKHEAWERQKLRGKLYRYLESLRKVNLTSEQLAAMLEEVSK